MKIQKYKKVIKYNTKYYIGDDIKYLLFGNPFDLFLVGLLYLLFILLIPLLFVFAVLDYYKEREIYYIKVNE